jgi:hypothetical protein
MFNMGTRVVDNSTDRVSRLKDYETAEQRFFDQPPVHIDRYDDDPENDATEDNEQEGNVQEDGDEKEDGVEKVEGTPPPSLCPPCSSRAFPEVAEQSYELIKKIAGLLESAADLNSKTPDLKAIPHPATQISLLLRYEGAPSNNSNINSNSNSSNNSGDSQKENVIIYVVRPVIYPMPLKSPERMQKYLEVTQMLLPGFLMSIGRHPQRQIIVTGAEDAGPVALLLAWKALTDHPYLRQCSGRDNGNALNQVAAVIFESGMAVTERRAKVCPLGRRNVLRFYRGPELLSRDFEHIGHTMSVLGPQASVTAAAMPVGNRFNDPVIEAYTAYPRDLWKNERTKSSSVAHATAAEHLARHHSIAKFFSTEAGSAFSRLAGSLVVEDQEQCAALLADELLRQIMPRSTDFVPFKDYISPQTSEAPVAVKCHVDKGDGHRRDVPRKVRCRLMSTNRRNEPVHIEFAEYSVQVVPLDIPSSSSSCPAASVSSSAAISSAPSLNHQASPPLTGAVNTAAATTAATTNMTVIATASSDAKPPNPNSNPSSVGGQKKRNIAKEPKRSNSEEAVAALAKETDEKPTEIQQQGVHWTRCLQDMFSRTTNLRMFAPLNRESFVRDMPAAVKLMSGALEQGAKVPRQCRFQNDTDYDLLMNAYYANSKLFYRLWHGVITSTERKPASCGPVMAPSTVDDEGNASKWLEELKTFLNEIPLDSQAMANRTGVVETARFKLTTLDWPPEYPFPASFPNVLTRLRSCLAQLKSSTAYDCDHPATLFAGLNDGCSSYCPLACEKMRKSAGCNRTYNCGDDIHVSVHGDSRMGSLYNETRDRYVKAMRCDAAYGFSFHFVLEIKPVSLGLLGSLTSSMSVSKFYGSFFMGQAVGKQLLKPVGTQ